MEKKLEWVAYSNKGVRCDSVEDALKMDILEALQSLSDGDVFLCKGTLMYLVENFAASPRPLYEALGALITHREAEAFIAKEKENLAALAAARHSSLPTAPFWEHSPATKPLENRENGQA